jgi:hypothetical protein
MGGEQVRKEQVVLHESGVALDPSETQPAAQRRQGLR